MIKLGAKIRALRKQKNISQEVLAEYLGVSFQAVSKWETEAAMPDVTFIPAIASFFGVSTDELFDFNLYEIEKNVEKIVDEHSKCRDEPEKCEAILREGLKKYPGNDVLLNCLIGVIPVPERADEVIELSKALISGTHVDHVRFDAYRIMAEAYYSKGEYALCKDAIEHIPEIYFTKLEIAAILLQGDDQFKAAAKQLLLSFESTMIMCRRLAFYYEKGGDAVKALFYQQMTKKILLAAEGDYPTPYTLSLFEHYKDRLAEIETDIARLSSCCNPDA